MPPSRTASKRLTRRDDGRIGAGVAAGLGAYLGIDANLVRLAFVVLTLAGGLGVIAYIAAWLLMDEPRADPTPPRSEPDLVQAGALAVVVLGLLLLARSSGVWLGDAIVWPLVIAAFGFGLLWMRPVSPDERPPLPPWPFLERLPPAAAEAITVVIGTRRGAIARVGAGAALVGVGIVVLLASVESWSALRTGLLASAVMLVGLGLVLGPGLLRLTGALARERRDRIRADERAEVAAHLHDSVLQTLALVQRRADDPREVVRLARFQERELRSWLLTGSTGSTHGASNGAEQSLGEALERLAAEVETEYGVPVELVRVRDCPLEGLEPLLLASREGMLNAARHSGADRVSVYVEVRDDQALVWVRDRGRGFDPATVPPDRGGIAGSIVGRMTRNGGRATVHSQPGTGCELELSLPRKVRDNGEH
ncbi:MAG: ATP-binding protein [Actinomycetota bacterium]